MLGAGDLKRDHRVLWNVVLGLVLTAVAVDHHGRRAFLERLAEGIHTRDSDRHRLHDARAAAFLRAGIARWQKFGHTFPQGAFLKRSTEPGFGR